MLKLNDSFTEVLKTLSNKLKDTSYCVRGTCSLVLQNIEMNVDDIDIVCSKKSALIINELLKDYVVDPVFFKESDKFKSYFGKFLIDGVQVEIMGDWQIKQKAGVWSDIFDGSSFNTVDLDGNIVKVTKVEDELKMFLLMGRFNAYQKIKKQLNL